MDKGMKRRRDSLPTRIVYFAPNCRFAKLFTEESLDEIRETVRKRLNLSSGSHFLLFHDPDRIQLVEDDDFDAFKVYAQSVDSVHVIVELLPPSDPVAGPAATHVAPETSTDKPSTDPPRTKSTIDPPKDDPKHAMSSGSSAPGKGKRKAIAMSEVDHPAVAIPISNPNETDQERPKKKAKKVVEEATHLPGTTSVGDQERPKRKSKKTVQEEAPLSDPTSVVDQEPKKKKKTKPPKDVHKEIHSTDQPVPEKSVTFSLPEQLAQAISASASITEGTVPVTKAKQRRKSTTDLPSKAQLKKLPEEKKVADDDVVATASSDAATAFLRNLVSHKLPAAPVPSAEPVVAKPAPKGSGRATKKVANGSKAPKSAASTSTLPCPVCRTSPFHLRYRCPIVEAGSASIKTRIDELLKEGKGDHSQLIEELQGMLQKSLTKEAEKSKNVNARFSPSHAPQPAEAHQTDVSNALVDLSGRAAMTGPQAGDDEGSSESSDDSDGTPLAARKMKPPRPISPSADAELDEIIHGPVRPRLTIDDIDFDEEEELTENVVLENDEDDHDDRKLRRLSRKMTTPGSSDDENDEDEDDEVDESANAHTFSPPPPPVRPPSNEPSLSVDISLTAINARPSVEMDLDGDIAVNKALASDNAVVDLAKSFPSAEGEIEGVNPNPSSPAGARASSTPPREESDTERREIVNPRVSPPRTPRHAKAAPVADDPIEPAEGFSPIPVRRRNPVVPTTPSTPQRRIAQMKDRNGKLSARFAELDPSRLAAQSERSTGSPEVKVPPLSMPAKEQAISQPTRRTTRASSLAAIPPPPPLSEVYGKRKRGPTKTPEQRLQEAAAKADAKQEKERVRKESALAKVAAKTKPNTTSIQDSDCPPSTQDLAEPKKPTRRSPNKEKHSLTPQNTWTTLPHPSTSPGGEEDGRDRDSMCDELNPSSPDVTADREKTNPLFLHAESQLAFPYSQWNNSIPEEDSPKASDDEEEEDEVEASVQSSQPLKNATTTSYRRLTDIASQPSLFSVSPALRAADFLSATLPRAKDKRADLYGTAHLEEDDSSDSDSSAADLPSHIPKSRRAGMVRQSKIGT